MPDSGGLFNRVGWSKNRPWLVVSGLDSPRRYCYLRLIRVVIAKLGDKNMIVYNLVNKSMFIVNSPRPVARQAMFQLLRFANTFKRFALNILNQSVTPFKHGFVCFLPIKVVVPCFTGKSEFHSISSRSVPFPASSSAIDSRRWRAFAGERSRYAVSSIARKSSREIIMTSVIVHNNRVNSDNHKHRLLFSRNPLAWRIS